VTALIAPVHAQETVPHEFTFDIPCFMPAKITFNFAATNNATPSDISTFGAGRYTYSGAQNYFEFSATDVDEYHFTLELSYGTLVNQTILVGLWSGTMAMQGFSFKSIYEHVTMYVRLRVQKEPTYPTEQQVATQVVLEVQKNLEEYYQRMNTLLANQNMVMLIVSVIAAVVAIVSVTTPILMYVVLKQMRRG
jgi:hypothetical protein